MFSRAQFSVLAVIPKICIINKRRDETKDFSCCFQNKNNVIDELREGSRLSVASV